jgi:hypothetical protein
MLGDAAEAADVFEEWRRKAKLVFQKLNAPSSR